MKTMKTGATSTQTGRILREPDESLLGIVDPRYTSISCELDAGDSREGRGSWSSFRGALLAVCLVTGTKKEFVGTASMVAPGVALGALHVLGDYRKALEDESSSLVLCGAIDDRLELWIGWAATEVVGTDLMLLSLDYAQSFRRGQDLHILRLAARTPKIGEQVTIMGFRPSSFEFHDDEDGTVYFEGKALYGSGLVTKIYLTGRDSSMLPWPVFEIDCPTQGAMSGGPVFDGSGAIVGILTSSLSMADGGGPSYASFWWDAIDASIPGGWRRLSELPRSTSLRFLNLQGIACDIDNAALILPREVTGKNFAMCLDSVSLESLVEMTYRT